MILIHLKQFSYKGRLKQKLQTYVDFPLVNLDLLQYVIDSKNNLKKYNLFLFWIPVVGWREATNMPILKMQQENADLNSMITMF